METRIIGCSECGVKFSLPSWLATLYEKSGEIFTCPQGHRQCWKGEMSRIRETLEYSNKMRDQWYKEAIAITRSRDALKGVITRLKRKIAQYE